MLRKQGSLSLDNKELIDDGECWAGSSAAEHDPILSPGDQVTDIPVRTVRNAIPDNGWPEIDLI